MDYVHILPFKIDTEKFGIPEIICLLAVAFPPISPSSTTQILANITSFRSNIFKIRKDAFSLNIIWLPLNDDKL